MRLKKYKFKIVKSTNETAINIIKNLSQSSGIVIAENQKKGKGQYGRKWISYKGNVFVSIFFNIDRIKISLYKITKFNCLLVKKLIKFYCKNRIMIKYPNDLLVNKKKISGILQEIITINKKKYLIVGIGINLIKSPYIINYPTTNLLELTNKRLNKDKVILKLKKIYENFVPNFIKFNFKELKK